MRHGFLLVDKPRGLTSHDVVADVRRILGERHIGHLGTLDPAATGLLVLAVGGKALKVVELFKDLPKEYEAQVRFGAVSTTYDGEGVMEEVPEKPGWSPPGQAELQRLINDRFLGQREQVPPAFSAVKMGGERAYRKARQGRAVHVPPREVEIQECAILSYAYPELRLRVRCSAGTYIRSLAHDLGLMLRCGAYLARLRRMSVGEWSVGEAKAPAAVIWTDVRPLKDVLVSHPRLDLLSEEWEDVKTGQNVFRGIERTTIGWYEGLPVCILVPAGEGEAHPRKVL